MVTHMIATATATRARQFLVGIVIGVIPGGTLTVTIAVLGLLNELTLAIPATCYVWQVILAILLASAARWRWIGIGLGVMALLTPIVVVILLLQILPYLGQI